MRIKSLTTVTFLSIFLACLLTLGLFSALALQRVNTHIEHSLEHNMLRYAQASQALYSSELDHLLDAGMAYLVDAQHPGALSHLVESEGLDFATFVDTEGKVISRLRNNVTGDSFPLGGLTQLVASTGLPMASTEIISGEDLADENLELALSARIRRIPTPHQRPDAGEDYVTEGIARVVVLPIKEEGRVVSMLIIGDLLNRDHSFPDEVKENLLLEVSLFQGDVRISTTAFTEKGNRYVGTLLAESTHEKIMQGETFAARVWGIDSWMRAAYIPITNHKGDVIGTLCVGISEDEFRQSPFFVGQEDICQALVMVAALVLIFSVVLAYFFTKAVTGPLKKLVDSANRLSGGDFEHEVTIKSYGEINTLARTFNLMIRSLRRQMVGKEKEMVKMCKEIVEEMEKERRKDA